MLMPMVLWLKKNPQSHILQSSANHGVNNAHGFDMNKKKYGEKRAYID